MLVVRRRQALRFWCYRKSSCSHPQESEHKISHSIQRTIADHRLLYRSRLRLLPIALALLHSSPRPSYTLAIPTRCRLFKPSAKRRLPPPSRTSPRDEVSSASTVPPSLWSSRKSHSILEYVGDLQVWNAGRGTGNGLGEKDVYETLALALERKGTGGVKALRRKDCEGTSRPEG